jgi:hypothetical protein
LKSDLLRQFRNLFKEEKVRLNQRLLIFFFFLFLSTFIWLLTALDKEYVTEISYPVSYFNFPEDKIETLDLPEFFTLRVEASGYLLLKQKIGKSLYPLQIDILKYLPEIYLQDTLGFSIKTSTFRETIENQISDLIKIIEIKPESVKFLFAKKVSKEISVKPDLKFKLIKQFVLKEKITNTPEKIIVSGPVNIIDTITYISTEFKDLGIISESTIDIIQLKPIKNLSYSVNQVSVAINIEKFTESLVEIPVTVMNLPDSIKLQLSPELIRVYFCTGLSKYNLTNAAQFSAVADYNEIKESNAKKLTILIKEFPSHVFNLKVSPRTVDFIIKTQK